MSDSNKPLVIVESPTKAKTMRRFLGDSYKIMSSMGHVRDLPPKKLGIKIENDFKPDYKILKKKTKVVREIRKAARDTRQIYLATDLDREGESISWHIKALIEKSRKKGGPKDFSRVVFHEITKSAITEAFSKPKEVDFNKINAQQARRLLDRIVGFLLSPFLWKRICRGLSAGRVQSVALKFIVTREKEIKKFVPQKYYVIDITFEYKGQRFKASFLKDSEGNKSISDSETAERIKESLLKGELTVDDVTKRTSLRKPPPPFITSSLQQDAFRNLRFSSSKTMVVAQKLYEGIELDQEEMTGLITYMRTDSFQISKQAKEKAKEFVKEEFGSEYLSGKEYKYKSKKGAQAAHEAIRPTSISRRPRDLQDSLLKDEFSLYELIWKRFAACFMKEAKVENKRVVLEHNGNRFSASGVKVLFDGFMKIYPSKIKEESLPDFNKGEKIKCINAEVIEKVTKPPSRYNDASLVRLLEDKGIGRPSTYAPTIHTLILRNYVRRRKRSLSATDLGIVVTDLLMKCFPDVLSENFTALMEEELDNVERGKVFWKKILRDFYPKFKQKLDKAEQNTDKYYEPAGMTCPKCGKEMVVKYSRKGKFISCSDYPRCKYALPITTGVKCPECKTGELVERRNRRGQTFYGCSNFPKCKYTTSELPEDDSAEDTEEQD